jgi:hypothetical protein
VTSGLLAGMLADGGQLSFFADGGNKSGQWKSWYRGHLPLAGERYRRGLAGEYTEEE